MLVCKSLKRSFNCHLLCVVICCACNGKVFSQDVLRLIDSLKNEIAGNSKGDKYVNNCFAIADNFMELNQYDSAQLWLNKIAAVLPLKELSISGYFLSTRQAEVYYYNGLQRLGLQESERSMSIAKGLNDSILLADACNFIGLFLINLDSNRTAIPYFKKGIGYARQPPYPAGYLSLTKPHHLYGNMAEAYQKMGNYDSAVYLSERSLQLATAIKWQRGIAVAYNALGNAFQGAGKADSALLHFQFSVNTSQNNGLFDVELLDYGGLAKAEDLAGKKAAALQWLQQGFSLIAKNPSINNLFANQFLDDAVFIYKKYEQYALLTTALQKKSQLLQQQIKNNNQQMNVILNAGLQNETRLLNLEVQQAKQQNEIINTRLYLLISFIALLLAAFFLYRYRTRQKLQLMQLQNKISQDLHDDVGSSLSSMQVYSTVAEQLIDGQPAKAKDILKKISAEAGSVMENISDIVLAMKPGNGQSIQLDARIKNFASDTLSAANINYVINIEEGVEAIIKNFTAKKNILLIIKAAIDNVVKYSNASHVSVSVKKIDDHICVQVADNGKGFNNSMPSMTGQGFANMQFRTEELKGVFEISSTPGKGSTVSVLLPITIISDTV